MSLNSNSSDTNNECQDKNKPKDVSNYINNIYDYLLTKYPNRF